MKISDLKTCDILLYRNASFSSKLIQWGTKSPYSHVGVVADPAIFLSIEANTGHQSGVRAVDLRQADEDKVDVYRVKEEFAYDSGKVVSCLVAHLGAPFDFWGVIALGVLKVASFMTGFKLFKGYNKFQKDRDYFCSELVYEAFQAGGLDIVPEVDSADITSPGDIAESSRIARCQPEDAAIFSAPV